MTYSTTLALPCALMTAAAATAQHSRSRKIIVLKLKQGDVANDNVLEAELRKSMQSPSWQ
jgi:hypothetical protein